MGQPAMFKDVKDFHEKFGFLIGATPQHLTKRKLRQRRDFMAEELGEFTEALESQDLAEMADALVDLVYVALGTAVSLGLPWDKLWADVHRANMAKVRGMTARGYGADVKKPPGWVPPEGLAILKANGYDVKTWTDRESGAVIEQLCFDDEETTDAVR